MTGLSLSGLVPDRLKVRSARILLESLEVQADIGFHDFEVGAPQRLLVTVEVWLEDPTPPADDDPNNACSSLPSRSKLTPSKSMCRHVIIARLPTL